MITEDFINNCLIRRAQPEEARDFSRLIIYSAPEFLPYVFGTGTVNLIEKMFSLPGNLFSFDHVSFLESNGKTIGMILGYSFEIKKKEEINTAFLLLQHMKLKIIGKIFRLLIAHEQVGRINKKEYYLSNIAVDPEYRSMGAGKLLIKEAEKEVVNSD